MVSASASVLVGRELSAGSYQDLVNWYCSLLTRRTVYGRAAGNSPRTTTTINQWNETWNCRNSVVALQDHCSYKAPTTNHHIKHFVLNVTSPWPSVKRVRFGADRSGVRLWAWSYQDLVNWYCDLLTRRTVCRRAAGNTIRAHNIPSQMIPDIVQTQSWR